ncbi:MAG: ABC transporter permease, partial [Alkalispirochaetaceae bacterium]
MSNRSMDLDNQDLGSRDPALEAVRRGNASNGPGTGPAGAPVNEFEQEVEGVSLTKDAWRRLKKNKMAMFGLVAVIIYAAVSVAAPLLPIHSYRVQVPAHRDLPPSLTKSAGELWYERERSYMEQLNEAQDVEGGLTAEQQEQLESIQQRIETETMVVEGEEIMTHQRRYLLGTDNLGRDMLARIIYGGQVSIAIGLVGTAVSVLIGILLGALAGYVGGKTDYMIMRVVDVMYGLPYMLIVIILMAIFGSNIINLFVALALVSWLTVARVVRGQIISLKNSEFVEAARSMGAGTWRIIFRHLVP